ncbi:MAG TPA: carbamoyltransferase [Acidobacteriota bacterium]|nr:carbamoyltransferase [Acidobacteriota bacterium]
MSKNGIRILGISAFYHDSAACLLHDGKVVAAVQEERYTRVKHDSSYPSNAIAACLQMGGIESSDLDYVVFYEKPFSKFERLLETYGQHVPRGIRSWLKSIPVWIKEKLWIKQTLQEKLDFEGPVLFAEHHESHAASAFYPSPFESAAILTVDGVGEWATTTLGRGQGSQLVLEQEIRFPHSVGLLYTAFTYHLGFKVNSGEYKVMGLAPYGQPRYLDLIFNDLVELGDDGSFRLDGRYFDYEAGLHMTSSKMNRLLGHPPREPESELTQFHKDLAASAQKAVEEILVRTARHLRGLSGERRLVMAGGVALNCVANGRILREAGFDDIWVQPAAGDAGGAMGAALAVWHRYLERPRQVHSADSQNGSLLGRAYSDSEIEVTLRGYGAVYHRLEEDEMDRRAARCLAGGDVLGWFQGRMEYGPRALGSRSILADPRGSDKQEQVNLCIKFRESFRPFAPAVLEERAADYFELDRPSPYMLLVAPVRPEKRRQLPSITHVDGSARVQTVDSARFPRFHSLLHSFHAQSGCPVVLNTSFNVRGEPIVESPDDAYQCFMRTGMDALAMGSFLLLKSEQPTGLEER